MAISANEVIQSTATVSDKIRALDAAGHPRAEIAKLLGKRYQHVRNVLEADRTRLLRTSQPPAVTAVAQAEPIAPVGGVYRLVVREDGSVLLPPEVLERLEVKRGEPAMGELNGESFNLVGWRTSVRRAQAWARSFIPEGVSLVDELLADRRREVERERG